MVVLFQQNKVKECKVKNIKCRELMDLHLHHLQKKIRFFFFHPDLISQFNTQAN